MKSRMRENRKYGSVRGLKFACLTRKENEMSLLNKQNSIVVDSHSGKKRIFMFGTHFAWVEPELKDSVKLKYGIQSWIKQSCEDDFGITLESKDDIILLDKIIKEQKMYSDKGEWVREKMRRRIEELENKKKLSNTNINGA